VACPDADTLNTFVAGRLDSAQRATLADHAATCADCHGVLEALLEAAPADEPTKVDRYVIERRIGAGAMGVVFAARDPELERPVAIKLLRGGASPERLRREAQLLARLEHPNVVAVYDVGEHAGDTFLAMALVDGANLRGWLATAREPDEILRVLCEAGRGVAAAHAAGLIHRDLKPDNIFVATDGGVRVGDFGLARLDDRDVDTPSGETEVLTLTRSGMVPGTPAYMAPEHAAGKPTPASDQFSFCVTAWEALCGMRPFKAPTFGDLQAEIRAGNIVSPPDGANLPARIRGVLERGLRPDPEARWPSMDALLAALAPRRRRSPYVIGGVLAVGAAAAALAFALRRDDPADRCAATTHELDDVTLPAPAQELLAGYLRDWLALRRNACVAPRGEHDPRVACLDRAHGALHAFAADAANADPDRLRDAALALPRLGECENALEGAGTEAQRIAGEALRAKLAKLDVDTALSGAKVLDDLRGLETEANKLGYAPAMVDIALVEAYQLARSARVEEAGAVLRRALAVAEAAHDDRDVAAVASQLAPIAIALGKLDEGRTMIELAAAALERAGGDLEIEIRLVEARAQLVSVSGDHDAAIALARSELDKVRAKLGARSPQVIELSMLLGRELAEAGRVAEARDTIAGLPMGDTNPVALLQQGLTAMAAADTVRMRDLGERAYLAGDNSAEVQFQALVLVARSYEFAGDGRMMVESYQRVAKLLDGGAIIDNHYNRAIALQGIGLGYLKLHEPARALTPLRSALDKFTAIGDRDERITTTNAIGRALVDAGKPHDARMLLEPHVRELASIDALPQWRAGAAFHLARALWDDGDRHDRDRALALSDDAVRDYRAGIDRLNGSPLAPIVQRNLDDVIAWRGHHK
jgi:tetratricopeptide (TPR) repeat protein